MQALDDGWYQAEIACGAGTQYRFECVQQDGSVLRFADPASRRQHCDVHDVRIVVDPHSYRWHYPLCRGRPRSEEHTSELQYLMRNSYAVLCLKKTNHHNLP